MKQYSMLAEAPFYNFWRVNDIFIGIIDYKGAKSGQSKERKREEA